MRILVFVLCLAACGRPLTQVEMSFATHLYGDALDAKKVRLVDKAPIRSYTMRAPKRPRVACTERVFPPPKTEIVTGAPSALALFNTVFVNSDYYLKDYMRDYPRKLYLYEAMFLAHELTHAWQWQNRKVTKYHPIKAAKEHQTAEDPYLFDPDEEREFLEFGYEQQGRIVEEYLCCSLLDPDAPRTTRLAKMIDRYFPTETLPVRDVIVGWKDVKVERICH